MIETANLGKYAKLLIIVGEDAPNKAQDLFDILAQEPDLRTHVTAAVLVGKRRWNIRMDNDVDVKLPEDGALEAWRHFAELNRQNNLLDKDVTGKGGSADGAAAVGKLIAERGKAANVTEVVFDRGGYLYHGRVKALAEAAREAGLQF